MTRRRNKKSKASKSDYSKTDRTDEYSETVEQTKDRQTSLKIRALQDDYFSDDYILFKPN